MSRTFLFAAFVAVFVVAAAPPKKAAVPEVPAALKPLGAKVGPHYAFKGVALTFKSDAPLTEEQWAAVAGVKVKFVSANGKGIDDAALARLAALPLEGLSVDGGAFTDAGLAPLGGMATLKRLSLSHNLKIKGTGAGPLAKLSALESFAAGGTTFGAAGVPPVASIKGLKELKLHHAAVTDACVTPLADHPSLEVLVLSPLGTVGVTDASLPVIATLKNLRDLTLTNTVLSREALEKLKGLPKLKKLALKEIGLSAGDADRLKAELSGVAVEFTPMPDAARAKWEKQAAKQKAGK